MIKNVIEIKDVCKKYDGCLVVDHINMCVEEGDIYGLIGPNGSGKTTTIKMILNLINRNSGSIKICGYDIDSQYKEAISNVGVSFTLDGAGFYEYLTGYQNLKIVYDICQGARQNIDDLLEVVGLTKSKNLKVKKYSTGMKQRLGIGRALINKPRIVILDEPTNGLDPEGIRDIYTLIVDLARNEKITFLISSHSLHDIERVCNKIILIKNGEILLQGKTNEILDDGKKNLEEVFFECIRRDADISNY